MNIISKFKIEKYLIVLLFVFILISLICINSAEILLEDKTQHLVLKQLIWYIFGIFVIILIISVKNNFIIKHIVIFYIIGNFLLLCLLLFAKPINDARCWFTINGIGTIQPSEFMKIILIIFLSKLTSDFNLKRPSPNLKEEFIFLITIILIILPPSLLTFLEPDTGVVLIYILITTTILFISGIRYRWFLMLMFICFLFLATLGITYYINKDLFIKLFGTDFFLRIDRLLDWSSKSGYQLENGLVSIGSAGFFGHGLNKTPLYFPEPHTDFVFAVYSSNFGFLGSLILFIVLSLFNIKLILTAIKNNHNINKYIIAGIVGMLLYQQFQNIGMTFGLMPITGITLPFISYGGSSLISYMIMIGIVFNISNENSK
ncbi:MAG: FtsW/RodA/SpoVE family cell cycle protein [Bacilli bacterium]|nr:FtsW/RodA/SpoVE family cell cycle protein [Bacilli bacterium]